MSDEILWINHAGYELRTCGLRIVHDPWTDGRAFADGWALVSESRYRPQDFAGVDYLWFSHEHPDHFAPAVLKQIPDDIRRGITVLFQQTRDGRVGAFCRKLGFRVQELKPMERTALSDDVYVTCGVANGDSWLFLETREHTFFNANDVVGVDWLRVKAALARPIDFLLTQFSYANWVGNPGDYERMASQAALKFAEMDRQIKDLCPRTLIPFASYVWFCRDDNYHLNACANRIDRVYERFKDRIETVVLYPGDLYEVGTPFDSEAAVGRYVRDWERHDCPVAIDEPIITLPELARLSQDHQQNLHRANAMWLLRPLQTLGFIRTVRIHLRDLRTGISYNTFGGLLETGLERSQCEIEMSSASFANMLRNGYGYATLSINGRFLELQPDASLRLSRHFAIAAQNEQGFTVPGVFLRSEYVMAHLGRTLRAVRNLFGRHGRKSANI